jgi:hypothetical protein
VRFKHKAGKKIGINCDLCTNDFFTLFFLYLVSHLNTEQPLRLQVIHFGLVVHTELHTSTIAIQTIGVPIDINENFQLDGDQGIYVYFKLEIGIDLPKRGSYSVKTLSRLIIIIQRSLD